MHWFHGFDFRRASLRTIIDTYHEIESIERMKSGDDRRDHRGRVEEHVRNLARGVNGN